MKITTISATYERKINLGDFSSANIGVSLWAELDEGDNEADCTIALRDMARNHVMDEYARVTQNVKLTAKLAEAFMGLPVELKTRFDDIHPSDGNVASGTPITE